MLNLMTLATPLQTLRRRLAGALPAATAALLVACGGGGGGGSSPLDAVQGPPETVASLVASDTNASRAAQAVVDAAATMAEQSGALTGLNGLFAAPVGLQRAVVAAHRVRPQAVFNLSCAEFLDGPPCAGSVVVNTNVSDNATSLRSGDFLDVSFQNLSGSLLGEAVQMSGAMRLDMLSSLNLEAPSFNGVDMVITFTAFRGSVAGVAFGPVDQAGRLQISTQGVASITADGSRFSGLSGVTYTGEDAYAIAGGSLRTAYWADATRYVDLNLTNWRVSNGRPLVGSAGEAVASNGGVGVVVVGNSDSSVTYDATITVGGVSTRYRVTAIYPVGGGAPGYSAVPLGS